YYSVKTLLHMDLLVSSISAFLAFGIGRMSVVNSPVLYPDAHPMRIERGAYDALANLKPKLGEMDN
ncbi:MAG: hypothetical protein LH679_07065, partial [Cyanobacteria bacterium CAN_BIN43]|nr:hypothetical protein [Cyanobacteria bacterium CAN_BIN43]